MKLVSMIATLVLAAPLALGAQESKATAPPMTAPPGFEIPKDMTPYFLAIYVAGPKYLQMSAQLHPAMLPSLASLTVKY